MNETKQPISVERILELLETALEVDMFAPDEQGNPCEYASKANWFTGTPDEDEGDEAYVLTTEEEEVIDLGDLRGATSDDERVYLASGVALEFLTYIKP